MTSATDESAGRARRRVLLIGGLALAVLFAAGAVVRVPWVEDDLQDRVQRNLAAQGIVVTAEFSGQDGTLRCAAPLTSEQQTTAVVATRGVWGVRVVTLAASCRGDGSVSTSTTTPATTSVAPTTTPAPTTTLAPSTTQAPTTTVAAAPVVSAVLLDGRLTLTGRVASEAQKAQLLVAAGAVATGANVVDQLSVDAAAAVTDGTVEGLGTLMAAMPPNLVSGEAGWNGTAFYASGVFADDQGKAAFEAAAAAAGVVPALVVRPTATAEQAAALEAELNALVAAEPILFDKGSTTISAASQATVQKVAGIAKRFAGVRIEVQGHTDSEGDAGRNLTLSEQRSVAVRDALVGLGVPATDLVATGFGETQLVADADGKEIPDKSRRVVFGVTTI